MTSTRIRRAAARTLAATALAPLVLLCGCQSQWLLQTDRAEIVRTELVVRTEPPGGTVYLNETRMDSAPVRIPIEYEHVTQQFVRQSNYGAAYLESSSTLGIVLGFPYWIPASLFHGTQEMKRHVYGANRHQVSARLDGWEEATTEVTLEGQREVEVRLKFVR